MKKLERILAVVIAGGLIYMLLYGLTSCTPKYGCGNGHKKQSWGKMMRRINSPR